MFFPFTGLEFITNQTGDQQMIGKKNRVKMKEPCGAIKERRLIRSRIQHRRQNLFHTSRKFKTKQNKTPLIERNTMQIYGENFQNLT